MAKKYMQMSGSELVDNGSPKAVAELVRRHNLGKPFAIKRLAELGLDHEGNDLDGTRVSTSQVAQPQVETPDQPNPDLAALTKALCVALGMGFPMDTPEPAKKTRKVKSVVAPPVFTEATLTAMPRKQLKELAGVGASSKLRSNTLVQQILGGQQQTQTEAPKHTSGKYLTGMKGRRIITDDGVMLEILGTSKRLKNGEYSKKAGKHDTTGAIGKGDTAKEAMFALNDGLAEQGYRIGWKSNWFGDVVDERTGITKSNRPKRRNTNKSAVMNADLG